MACFFSYFSVTFLVLTLTCSSANSASQFDALKGSFSIGELGTARFEVKLRLPKSSGSFAPNIGISYESGAADRLMGPGWAVTGLSQITRCPKTIGQHGTIEGIKLNSPGPFCLDGKLLIAVQGDYGKDGTVYRTEHEAFSRIVSFGSLGNGPEWFSVETKSGQILEFGRSPSARRALGKPINVLGWGVEIVSDRSKNFYFVEYESSVSEGWQVPKRIVFSGNRNVPVEPSHVIEFSYGPRANYTKSFVDGEYSLSKHLLQTINTLSDGNRIASYGFSYEPSPITTSERLIRIDHCAVDGDCLAPLQFSWEARSLELSGPYLVADLPITGGVVDFVACLRGQFFTPWDIRFNGRSDLVCHTPGPQNTLATYVATGDISSDTGLPTFGEWRRRSDDSQPEFLTNASCAGRILAADVNGDGIPDWVCIRDRTIPIVDAPADKESQVFVQLGRIESGEPATRSVSYSSWTVWSDVFHHRQETAQDGCATTALIDLDGDGRTDLVCMTADRDAQIVVTVLRSTGSKFEIVQQDPPVDQRIERSRCLALLTIDLNADGIADLVCVARAFDARDEPTAVPDEHISIRFAVNGLYQPPVYLRRPGGFSHSQCSSIRTADVNGDGASDLVCVRLLEGKRLQLHVALNNGRTFDPWADWSIATAPFDITKPEQVTLADVNADGRYDIILTPEPARITEPVATLISHGSAFSTEAKFLSLKGPDNAPATPDYVFPFPFTGDRAAELLAISHEGTRIKLYAATGGLRREIITRIENGVPNFLTHLVRGRLGSDSILRSTTRYWV
jgi:hypothetical protein